MKLSTKKEWISKIVCSIIISFITYAIVLKEMGIESDYMYHAHLADTLNLHQMLFENTYFIWHLLVKIASRIFFMPIEYAAAFVSAAVNISIYLLAAKIMEYYNVRKSELAAFALVLIGPIYIPWFNPSIYLGQWSPNIWHNPTSFIVKPFAMCSFFIVTALLKEIHSDSEFKKRQLLLLTLFLYLSVMSKPSFIQAFVPGLGLYMLISCVKHKFKYFKKYFILCLTFIPSMLVIAWQFVVSFYTSSKGSGIEIGWMEFLSITTPNIWISTFLLLSFPILYLILNIKKITCKTDIQLALSTLLMAFLEAALLCESGKRKYDGNFVWAYLLAVFIIWMVCLLHFIKDLMNFEISNKLAKIKNTVLLVSLMLHFACGCYYIFRLLSVTNMTLQYV